MSDLPWIWIARFMLVVGLICGVIGLLAGLTDHMWKLGVTGWFTGGTLLAVSSIAILIDLYTTRRLTGTR